MEFKIRSIGGIRKKVINTKCVYIEKGIQVSFVDEDNYITLEHNLDLYKIEVTKEKTWITKK